ncbi:MAG TPA: isochorismatase family protein [Desulfobacteraceae bacterium]|nr:isochorismatase family protein [Desulfobacteraceae bacterium]
MEYSKMLLKQGDCALVVIDVQERLVQAVQERESLVGNIIKLMKFARLSHLPVVITEQQKLGPTVPEISSLVSLLRPITKLTFDCFKNAEFVDRIQGLGKKTLIVAGIEAHICVLQTAIHGVSTHRLHVVADAISSRSLHDKEMAISRMVHAGVTITSTETVIYEIMGQAGTELFKKVLPLVR